ncbi:MAG TPA: triose-phosphate isomerase [Nitrososphaeraceae archaeon]|nr:triose-phosphate isomerase [Nitrososphaeraceae archaeon]
MKRPLIINFKNYLEVSAYHTIKLAKLAEQIADNLRIEIVLAPPQPSLSAVIQNVKLPVICQHVDDSQVGSTTGFFVPEIAKSYGAVGSLINHSEHRLNNKSIRNIIERLHQLNMFSVVCAQTAQEVAELADLSPNFIAVEPPELIGSGKAVSKVNPLIIIDSLQALAKNSMSTKMICGAGITDKSDVISALELGAEGILVASSVVKAKSWSEKLFDLASAFKT